MYTYEVQWNERLYYKATVTTDMTPEDDGFDDASDDSFPAISVEV